MIYARSHVEVGLDREAYGGYLYRYQQEPMSHPHPAWRRQALLDWIKRHIPSYYEQSRRMDSALQHLLQGAYLLGIETIDAALADGLALHPRWDGVMPDIEALRAHGRELLARRTPRS